VAEIQKFFLSFANENSEGIFNSARAEIFFEGLNKFHQEFFLEKRESLSPRTNWGALFKGLKVRGGELWGQKNAET
jgi:hypothetical protein